MDKLDRYVSSASLTIRPHPSPTVHRAPPYRSAQPIHPVLQRRNTPHHMPHHPRRLTQPVAVAYLPPEPAEQLSQEMTGRMPIPPPRGPRCKVGVTRNSSQVLRHVSHNGLRSPRVSGRDMSPQLRAGVEKRPVKVTPEGTPRERRKEGRQSFDEIVDEIFKTIGTEEGRGEAREYAGGRTRVTELYGNHGGFTQGSPRAERGRRIVCVEEPRQMEPPLSAYAYHRPRPSPSIQRSKSDASGHRLPFPRPLSLIPTPTVPNDLASQGHATAPDSPNVMQRMRKSLSNLRSGVLAKLNRPTQYTRKSSYPCDLEDADEAAEMVQRRTVQHKSIFYDGLVRPVDVPERGRKPTSADSGIVDLGQEDEMSSSSRPARPTSTEYSSGCGSPMRRSRSCQPNGRLVSFAIAPAGEKCSDLDRSVSARSSRTSDLSNSSASSHNAQAGNATATPASPLYIESLWSQVKYEVDCEQNVAECSTEGMRANIVKEILKNERDFVDNLKDVIEGYLYKCRQRPDMFSKGRIECIFGNIEQLYEFQTEFLTDLEVSISTNNVHRSEIGHCFLLHQRGFSELYSDYCNNHTQSAMELQQLKQIKQYAHFFEACRMLQDMVEISLDGFLLQPVQKICKYPLQLCELLKYTPESHPDCQSVKLALNAMKSVTGVINERKRRLECLEKIAFWQETIDLWDGEDLVERSSQLIHYGDLSKLSSKNSWTHEYVFFLFDHQLIYCRRDMIKRTLFTYKGRFDMDQVDLVDLEQNDAGIKHGWVVVCPDKEQSTILLAKSVEEKKKWMEAFDEERRRVQTDLETGFAIAPKDRLAAIQTAKMLTAGKEKRSKSKDALKDLTDHTQLVQSMRAKSISMTLPVRIKVNQSGRNDRRSVANKLPFTTKKT